MRRPGISLAVTLGIVVSLTAAGLAQLIPGLGGNHPADEPPLLARINALDTYPDYPLERLVIRVNDWVELYAEAPLGDTKGGVLSYKFDFEIQGKALEQVAEVQPARLFLWAKMGEAGNRIDQAPSFERRVTPGIGKPHLLLKGIEVGTATVRLTIPKGGTRKEILEFEVRVVTEGESLNTPGITVLDH